MSDEPLAGQMVPGEPIAIDGGWRVRETKDYYVDVMTMAFGNKRIVETPKADPVGYERGWCYHEPLPVVVLRCFTFEPGDRGSEPVGWVKQVGTERRGCKSYYRSKIQEHEGYDPDCPDCGNEALA